MIEWQEKRESGFVSPAAEYRVASIDLNASLVSNPTATFLMRAKGNAMRYGGIHSGDTLVVDRSRTPRHDDVVVAVVHGELLVRRLLCQGRPILQSDHPGYVAVELTGDEVVCVWGVVTAVIRSLVNRVSIG